MAIPRENLVGDTQGSAKWHVAGKVASVIDRDEIRTQTKLKSATLNLFCESRGRPIEPGWATICLKFLANVATLGWDCLSIQNTVSLVWRSLVDEPIGRLPKAIVFRALGL